MDAVFVIGKNGERLMPTHRLGHVRHLLCALVRRFK